jgi:UDP-glucose 4-epimerase
MNFLNKNILISGGCGLIGSNLAIKLVNMGAKITIIDSMLDIYGGNYCNINEIKDKITLNISDIRDEYSMSHLLDGKDYFFNLAAQTSHVDSMQNPMTDLAINVTSQLSILENIRKINPKIRIVYASTRQIYGKPNYLPVDEKHTITPVDINGIHKLAGEGYHQLYQNVYGINSTCLRLTNTYGPGMRVKDARQTFLGIWVKQIISGETIKIFGDGEQKRDFNFVEDVIDAILLSSIKDNAIGKIYNLGSNEVVSLNQLATDLININGGGKKEIVPFPEERKAIDIGDYYGDWSKIKEDLKWQPKINLHNGLQVTLDYYKKNKEWYWKN